MASCFLVWSHLRNHSLKCFLVKKKNQWRHLGPCNSMLYNLLAIWENLKDAEPIWTGAVGWRPTTSQQCVGVSSIHNNHLGIHPHVITHYAHLGGGENGWIIKHSLPVKYNTMWCRCNTVNILQNTAIDNPYVSLVILKSALWPTLSMHCCIHIALHLTSY